MFEVFASDYRRTVTGIPLGNQGEDQARCLVIDATAEVNEFGNDGAVTVKNKRAGDEVPYISTNVTIVSGTDSAGNTRYYIKWTLTDVDTAVEGTGFVQADYVVDSVIVKTWILKYYIAPSLGMTGDVPDPYIDLLDQIESLAGAASASAVSASADAATAEEAARVASITYGSPLVAATAAAMTELNRVYVYTGSETGYTNGNWYYYDGSDWASGGVYNGAAVNTDPSLSVAGMPADAGAVGELSAALIHIDSNGYFYAIT